MTTVLSLMQSTERRLCSEESRPREPRPEEKDTYCRPRPPICYIDDNGPTSTTAITPPANITTPTDSTTTAFIPYPIPAYVHKYPQICNAVPVVQGLVSEWKSPTPQGTYELECRFGIWKGQYFQNGVSKLFVEKILAMFDTFSQWTKVTEWEETHDYFYSVGRDTSTPNSSNLPMVRTTARFLTDARTHRKHISTEHIRKYTQSKVDFQYVSKAATDFRYDLRVGLNYEEKVSEQELPSVVNPSSVRIKSRKSYFYKSEDFPSSEPLWRYDITRSWLGTSRTDAELKQRNGDTVYEFELECLNPKALMVSPKHDALYVACSMLLKMKDFMAYACTADFKWEPLQGPQLMHDVDSF